MLANFHMYGIMLVLRIVFNMLVRNVNPRGHMCFRCLMFVRTFRVVSVTLFYRLLDLRCGDCDVISLYFICCSVFLVCLTVFVIYLVTHFVCGSSC